MEDSAELALVFKVEDTGIKDPGSSGLSGPARSPSSTPIPVQVVGSSGSVSRVNADLDAFMAARLPINASKGILEALYGPAAPAPPTEAQILAALGLAVEAKPVPPVATAAVSGPDGTTPFGPITPWQDAMNKAREGMLADRERKRVEQARAQIDPEFAQRERDKQEKARRAEEQKQQNQLRQSAGFAAVGLGAAGLRGPAELAGGFAAGGKVGLILAAIDLAKDKLAGLASAGAHAASSIGSMEPDKVARGLFDLAGQIPVVGSALSGLGNIALNLSDSLDRGIERIAIFNPSLMNAVVEREMNQLMNDIRRAQQSGPQLMAAYQARTDFNERLQRIIDDNLPAITGAATALLDALPAMLQATSATVGILSKSAQGWQNIFALINGIWTLANAALGILPRIEENTRVVPEGIDALDVFRRIEAFFSQGSPVVGAPVPAPAAAPFPALP